MGYSKRIYGGGATAAGGGGKADIATAPPHQDLCDTHSKQGKSPFTAKMRPFIR
jgi:hypothetical protein